MTINTTQRRGIVLVLAIGALLAGLILRQNRAPSPEAGHGAQTAAQAASQTKEDHAKSGHKDDHGTSDHKEEHGASAHKEEHGPSPHKDEHGTSGSKGGHEAGKADAHEAAQVAMSEAQMQQNGVTLGVAGPATIEQVLQLQGEIRLNEDRMVQLLPRVAGTVESVYVNAGDKVQKGQLLAVLHSAELADLRSQWLAAKQRFELARTSFEREQQLWQEKISPEQDFLQARHAWQEAGITLQNAQQKLTALGVAVPANKAASIRPGQRPGSSEASRTSDAFNAGMSGAPANPARYEVRAPISGTVTAKQVAVGQFVTPERAMLVIADLSTVWAEMAIPAKDLQGVQPGLQARVSASAFAHTAQGKLVFVDSVVGDASRNARARLVLPNPDGQWRPGLPVSVALVTGTVAVPLAVELAALHNIKEAPAVFGREGQAFEVRPLELGRRDGSRVEVRKGLQSGERYALGNSYLIKADIGKAGASHEH